MGIWTQTREPQNRYLAGAEVLGDEKFHSEAMWGTEGELRALEEKQLSSVHIAFA